MIGRLSERIANGEAREQLMNSEWFRFESFKEWPENVPVSSTKLAKNAFYYIGNRQNDKVKCYSCEIIIGDWKEFDDPSEIHKRRSPNCDFVRGIDGNNMPIHISNDSRTNPLTSLENGVVVEENTGVDGRPCDKGWLQHTLENPKYLQYINRLVRLDTYNEGWTKENVVQSVILADAGFFFTGNGDLVRCFCCGIGLRDWCTGDDPWIEHVKTYQWCRYLHDVKGKDFIQQHSNQEPTGGSEYLHSSNNVSSAAIGEAISDNVKSECAGMERRAETRGTETNLNRRKKSADNKPHDGTKKIEGDETIEGTGNQELDNMKMENERLKNIVMCKICLAYEVNIVFFPCGHLVSCHICAPHITKCAICRTQVEGRRKIFLA